MLMDRLVHRMPYIDSMIGRKVLLNVCVFFKIIEAGLFTLIIIIIILYYNF